MNVVILNTGCANFASIQIAIKKIGYSAIVTSNPAIVFRAKKIILPGVGTASAAMEALSKKKIISLIKNTNIPILGICLGMQILCDFSKEGGGVKAIGIFDSSVFPLKSNILSLPHMGWNKIIFTRDHFLFKNIKNESRFYFVHSYFVPVDFHTLAVSNYGIAFSAVIQKKNFFGVQFHPEKSSFVGAQLLKNFIEM